MVDTLTQVVEAGTALRDAFITFGQRLQQLEATAGGLSRATHVLRDIARELLDSAEDRDKPLVQWGEG